jgi:hypothetical protein
MAWEPWLRAVDVGPPRIEVKATEEQKDQGICEVEVSHDIVYDRVVREDDDRPAHHSRK